MRLPSLLIQPADCLQQQWHNRQSHFSFVASTTSLSTDENWAPASAPLSHLRYIKALLASLPMNVSRAGQLNALLVGRSWREGIPTY